MDVEFVAPIRAGDSLTISSRIEEFYEKTGRSGPLTFVVIRSTYRNQHGEVDRRLHRSNASPPAANNLLHSVFVIPCTQPPLYRRAERRAVARGKGCPLKALWPPLIARIDWQYYTVAHGDGNPTE
jgi:N-terminal half of MaoC dehydratase